jgi:hypothetical protein
MGFLQTLYKAILGDGEVRKRNNLVTEMQYEIVCGLFKMCENSKKSLISEACRLENSLLDPK